MTVQRPNMRVTIDKVAAVTKAMKELSAKRVLVGIPGDFTERKPDPDEPHAPTNAELGYIHEFGDPEANIPARPFLIPGVSDALPALQARLLTGARGLLTGKTPDVDTLLSSVGLVAQSKVRRRLTTGPFVPLSNRTLARRRARGRRGVKPLIDTGQLRQAVNFVVRSADSASD